MMTMKQYEERQEQVAFARAVCKLNRAPTPGELSREKLDLELEAKSGAEPYGIRANDGAKFLRELGLPLPGQGTMQPLPPDFKKDSHVITTTTIRPVKIELPSAAPQAKATARIELPEYRVDASRTIVEKIEAAESHLDALSAIAITAGITPPRYAPKKGSSCYSRLTLANDHILKLEAVLTAK